MEYAVILGIVVAVLGVKAYTMFTLGTLDKEIRGLTSEEEELSEKIDALDGTRTQLERDHKDILNQIEKLEDEKNRLVITIQKHGVVPVPEPSEPPDPPGPPPATDVDTPAKNATDETKAPAEAPEPAPQETPADETDPPETAVTDGAGDRTQPASDWPSVLIVDDNTDLLDILVEAFGRTYGVERAADGLEALDLILKQGRRYDGIVTDLNMPNLDGMAFLDHVPDGTRVVVMSAYLDRPEFAAAMAHPRVFRTVTKPFKLAEIREAVEALVAGTDEPVGEAAPAEDD